MFGLYYLVKLFWEKFIEPSVIKNNFSHINAKEAEAILLVKFQFYQNLSDFDKKRFLKRTVHFLINKEFIPSGETQMTEEMVVLISACAIQLTFGLEEYILETFSKIFVYPKEYYSKYDHLYHEGEANLNGAIVLSWNNFVEGYDKPHENHNLGLHEMAHALRFDKFKSDEYDEFFAQYLDKWHMVAEEEFNKLRNRRASFFREYGGSNFNEFFSVCVERFFESPREFKQALPEVYKHMCILLNQNPLEMFSSESFVRSDTLPMNTDFQLQEPIFYESENTVKNLLALIVAIGFWIMIIINALQERGNSASIFFSIVMPVAGYFVTNAGFKKIYLYSNGIRIKYFLPDIFKSNKIFSYDEVICIEFHERTTYESNDEIQIIYLDKGKIKTKSFAANLVYNQVLKIADLLVEKKIAVKLNEFAHYAK